MLSLSAERIISATRGAAASSLLQRRFSTPHTGPTLSADAGCDDDTGCSIAAYKAKLQKRSGSVEITHATVLASHAHASRPASEPQQGTYAGLAAATSRPVMGDDGTTDCFAPDGDEWLCYKVGASRLDV